jgi:hypothetical protein
MGDLMLRLGRTITTARQAARHRRECYRWDANGQCLDCGRFTGFPGEVVRGVAAGAIVYYRPGSVPKRRVARLAVTPVAAGAEPVERARSRKRTVQGLTPDQLATQRAWREWRLAQGDPQPDVPRRKRTQRPRPRTPA